jgi:hypothetical protein
VRKIEDPIFDIGTPVSDFHMGMLSVLEIDNPDYAAEWEGPMGSGQGLHVKQLTVGRLFAMKRFAIPGCDPAVLNPYIQWRGSFGDP